MRPLAVKHLIRAAAASVPLGLLLLVGGCAAVALGERALGGSLIALAVISVLIGWILMARVKSAVLAAMRSGREQRGAGPEGPNAARLP
jgi:ABC-type uncharacterized transport system permease subunit